MDGSVFFYVGGALVLAAVVLSAIGIRNHETFPPNRGVMAIALVAFVVLVVGATSTAVVNAREEQDKRRDKQAEEMAQAAESVSADEQTSAPNGAKPPPPGPAQEDAGTGTPPGGGAETSFDVTSPEDGSLVFDPDGLTARPGSITITYSNPSQVPHSIAIEADGRAVAQSDPITDGDTSVSAELSPGAYIYYCTVPGHREAGMEGTLTVGG
jgi:plastocyanin